MKRPTVTLALAVALALAAASACGPSEDKSVGAATVSSSAAPPDEALPRPSQGPLPAMKPLELPADPKRADKIALGHALFFDKRLSVDGTRACYSCHPNEHGSGGADPIAVGAKEKKLTRHSPVMWNVALYKGAYYWDGRSKTLEAQAKAAWAGANMGVGEENLQKKTDEIAQIAGYKEMFEKAFPGEKPTPDHVVAALAEYEKTLVCDDTAYDKFAKGDKKALGEAQQRGLDVFMTKGQCIACHPAPTFSSAMEIDGGAFFNVGIGTDKPEADVDVGRMKVTNKPEDWAAFKPPSLRNVSKSGPYFHDGSVASLEEAVKLMAGGGKPNKALHPLMKKRDLTDAEIKDLVAFLGALECSGKLVEPKLP